MLDTLAGYLIGVCRSDNFINDMKVFLPRCLLLQLMMVMVMMMVLVRTLFWFL